jgi:hypothetical protein
MSVSCAGLWDLELDIDHLTAVKDDQEMRLEKGAEALRSIKAKNEQVRPRACTALVLCCHSVTGTQQASHITPASASQLAKQQMCCAAAVAGGLLGVLPSQACMHLSCILSLQARQKLSSTCGSISQMYSFVDQATEATAAQLESTKLALQQHSAKQPATAEAPLEPGPGQVTLQPVTYVACQTDSDMCALAQAHVRAFFWQGCMQG